jgi:hypothetical protein
VAEWSAAAELNHTLVFVSGIEIEWMMRLAPSSASRKRRLSLEADSD